MLDLKRSIPGSFVKTLILGGVPLGVLEKQNFKTYNFHKFLEILVVDWVFTVHLYPYRLAFIHFDQGK